MFASSNGSYEGSDYVILGVPFDKTSSFRAGCDQGPEYIRKASYCFEPYMMEYDVSLNDIPIHDLGDIDDLGSIEQIGEALGAKIESIVGDNKIPIVMGGEHSISPYVISAFDEIDVIVFDAHLDFRDEYEGNKRSHATANRRISELYNVDKHAVVGVRSISKREFDKEPPKYFTADELTSNKDPVSELTKHLGESGNNIYISIDMDAVEPSFAPGVGNPEPFGLEPKIIKKTISQLSSKIIGMDVVEVNPKYDPSEITSSLAAKFIYELIGSKESI
ncbi:MAG: agmatinase [Thermoplasmatota archaeon]